MMGKVIAGVVVLLLAWGALTLWRRSEQHQGALRADSEALARRLKILRDSNTALRRAQKPESVETVRLVTRWRTVAARSLAPETTHVAETVYVTAPSARDSVLVAVADSAVNQCLLTLSLCDRRALMLDSLVAVNARRAKLEAQRRPGFFARARGAVVHGLVGAAVAVVVFR